MSKFGALARKRLQQQHADRLRAEILRRGQVEAEPEPDDEDTGPATAAVVRVLAGQGRDSTKESPSESLQW